LNVATLTIHLEDEVARQLEESARREHKSVSDWIKERIKSNAERGPALAAMEARAVANGYPTDWLTLYASLADDESFVGPSHSATRAVEPLNGD